MKNINHWILVALLSCCYFSCKNNQTNMMTVIHQDGSITKCLAQQVTDDSFFLKDSLKQHNSFPVEIDSSWSVEWKYGKGEFRKDFPLTRQQLDAVYVQDSLASKKNDSIEPKNNFKVILSRNFLSAEDMATHFRLKNSHPWHSLKIGYKLERKFRWFYTYYVYEEVYPKLKIPFDYPISEFMTQKEADYWFSGTPDLIRGMSGMETREYLGSLENKYNDWLLKNQRSNEFEVIILNYDRIAHPPVAKEKLKLLKDSVFTSKWMKDEQKDIEDILDNYFETKEFSLLSKKISSSGNDMKDSIFQNRYGALLESFDYKLCMPGELLNTNSSQISNDTLSWNLTGFKFLTQNYVIYAESRTRNIWAFIVTGLIIVGAFVSFLIKKKKK